MSLCRGGCGREMNLLYATDLEHEVECLASRLDSIERQAGDATEYVLAQIYQRLRDECARWKQVAEDAAARVARSEERVQAWANQARIDADMRFKAESRLNSIRTELEYQTRHSTHWDGCEAEHWKCRLLKLAKESAVERQSRNCLRANCAESARDESNYCEAHAPEDQPRRKRPHGV